MEPTFRMSELFNLRVVEKIPQRPTREELDKSLNGCTDPKELRSKLLDALIKVEDQKIEILKYDLKHRELTCNIDEDKLHRFFDLGELDQKMIGYLFWDKLTKKQKDVFSDKNFAEMDTQYRLAVEERMANPTKLKQYFLNRAAPLLDSIIDVATGNKKAQISDTYAFKETWEVLKAILNSAENPAPLVDLKGKVIGDQIDEILTKLTKQDITITEAKELMSLVSSGFSLQQLPLLMQKLEALENE